MKSWSLIQYLTLKIGWSAPFWEITMTSYPACKKTSPKPYIPDKELPWNAIRKAWLLFQNPSWKSTCSAPGGGMTMTSYPVGYKTSLSRKPCAAAKKLLWITIRSHGCSFRMRHEKSREARSSGGLTMTSYIACNKTSVSQKSCIADKKLLFNTSMKSWSLSNFYKK